MKVYINGKQYEANNGEMILEVATRNNLFIPTLCELKSLDHAPATCRVCLVEIKLKNNDEIMLVTSCNTPVEADMKIFTRSKKVRESQRMQVEMILADHDQNCSACIRHGNCELQDVAQFVGLTQTHNISKKFYNNRTSDFSSNAIVRDMSKCIRCFRCVAICRNIQETDVLTIDKTGLALEIGLKCADNITDSNCISCGQCTLVCPVGALAEKNDTELVIDYLYDEKITTVFQFAPAVRIAIGEEFGIEAGKNLQGEMITALKQLGADHVLDTNFAADLVIMEEGTELLNKIKNNGEFPLITSCSPGWINYVEKNYPEFLSHISTTRSPQQCFGAIAKTYLADKLKINSKKMRVISIMPCTAKKEEAKRKEFTKNGVPDIDTVLTTREFARLLKREGIWLPDLEKGDFDNEWMGEHSGAGEIFGTTGGVMEAAVRTVYYITQGKELPGIEYKQIRGIDNLREASLDLGKGIGTIKLCAANGIKAAKILMQQLENKTCDYHFIEIMGCPGGCMNGGGQPRNKKQYHENAMARQKAIYSIDKDMKIRQSHNNPLIKKLYDEFLGEPNSKLSHKLLHTHYKNRKKHFNYTVNDIWNEIKSDYNNK